MSYQLYFFRKKDLSIEEANDFLKDNIENKQYEITAKHYIDFKNKIKNNPLLEVLSISKTEINFSNYQITRHLHYMVMSIPYWEGNDSNAMVDKFYDVIGLFKSVGFSGYDPQSEMLLSNELYNFYENFTSSLEVVLNKNKLLNKTPNILKNLDSAIKFFDEKKSTAFKHIETLNTKHGIDLDFSPDSLIKLETLFYYYLDNDHFDDDMINSRDFKNILSIYLGEVYVQNKKFNWVIEKIYNNDVYQLAVQSRNGMQTIFLGDRSTFEKFRDKKNRKLYKEYMNFGLN